MKQFIGVAVLLIAAGGIFATYLYLKPTPNEVPQSIVTFSCEQGKTIGAVFYASRVELTLSDGRKPSLMKLAEGDAKYANADLSFVFWTKGNTAHITEGHSEPQAPTYINCVTPGEETPETSLRTYSYPPLGFSIKYPSAYSLNESHMYEQLGPEAIPGVKVSVPQEMSERTNLSADSGVSIEYFPNADSCSASSFLFGSPSATTVKEGGITYSVATSSGAAAGNVYEERVYALEGQDPCIAIRYFIHYTQLANYPAGTKKAFEREQLLAEFDEIRKSLRLKNQTPVEE